ncbi:hypothetical protein CXB51_003169 [Gossypium anomalum]|uniref:Piwi domain-containing protein n=1 Tax=Gossypium anomalum TaxID=47600 RepID=A0A8J5ZG37_9ROSI|nr:hypothetical protein CXB51_003169 [Gossypium anomalum]
MTGTGKIGIRTTAYSLCLRWGKHLQFQLFQSYGALGHTQSLKLKMIDSFSKPVSDKVDDDIMQEALLDFYTSSGKRKPDQIIIFRDGGSSDNVLHGTVIDNKVCHPKNNDFYLGTHAGMIGIMRQTHYHVLFDQAGFSADDLQEFLYSWGQFIKIRDASETSSSHGGMYAPGVISVP